ncbi:S-methyl-5-thioribose-1-phosphate isomerase [Lentisalinibacter sediminis]|uniref:S-methyl-5-thioribose-1-phosphate isomerase n=1 Tax=Lentisalinibacter sediminis TaxID=2992237 RepID=UPI00386E73F4
MKFSGNTPGENFRTIWLHPDDPAVVQIIDQRRLPHRYEVFDLRTHADGAFAIREMLVRGAPLIGATAAWSLYLAALEADRAGLEGDAARSFLREAAETLAATRPTAVNLRWGIERMLATLRNAGDDELAHRLRAEAEAICEEDVEISRRIGEQGVELLAAIAERKGGAPVNILTHCNAGSLATINWGTATAPMYLAKERGIPIHVWVDETRPRNQGSQLTAWELAASGIEHTVIVDNAGGHLMQHGRVDICITGTDRTTRAGDVANKIGTYLKALAARDNGIPFYVALPSTTIDWDIADGLANIPIEERSPEEVTHIAGLLGGEIRAVQTVAEDSPAANYAFDVTPARLVTGLITERGICDASEEGLAALFPDRAGAAA